MKLYKIKKSNIDKKGRGLYATKDIKEGTRIIDYVGKIITKKQTEESQKFDNAKPIYLFNLNKKYDMDGDVSWNTARLINHSCSNNCDYNGTGLKLWVVAIKDIKKVKRLQPIMVLVMMKITNSFHANVSQKIVVAILFEQSLDGELIKNLVSVDKKLVNNFF